MVTTPTSKQTIPGREYGLIALFILLAVVVGVVVTWYLTSDGDDSPTTTEVAPASLPAADAATTEAPARGGMAETIDTQEAIRSATPIAVYVVSSEDEADRLRMSIADADAITQGMGLATFEFRIVVIPPDVDPYPMFAEEQNFRNAEGLPGLTIHDMRSQSSETPDTAQAPVVVEEAAPVPARFDEAAPEPVFDNYTPYNIGP
jgi:hypothetical protein